MICENCQKETDKLFYAVSTPLLISKSQEWRGVIPSGDFFVKICENCKHKSHFHNPEFPRR